LGSQPLRPCGGASEVFLDLSTIKPYTIIMKDTIQEQINQLCLEAMKARGLGELSRINLELNKLRKELEESK
jgi:hypothetical protein